MIILQIILLSSLFTVIFIGFHFIFLYLFSFNLISFKKTVQQNIIPFVLGNLICFYLVKNFEMHKLFLHSFIINLSIFIIYVEFLSLLKTGFTISIITSFKKKQKFSTKKLIKSYAGGKGDKWVLLDRLDGLRQLKIIRLNKKIALSQLGCFLSIILIFLRKIFVVRDFG